MNKTISYLKLLILFALLTVLSSLFVTRGADISWIFTNFDSVGSFLNGVNGSFLSSLLSMTLIRYDYLKALFCGAVGTYMFFKMQSCIDSKNISLLPITVFLFFILDRTFLSGVFTSTTGFMTHMLGSLFIVLVLEMINKNSIYKYPKPVLVVIGLLSTLVSPIYTFTVFAFTLYYVYKSSKEGTITDEHYLLLAGTLLGTLFTVLNTRFTYLGMAYNLTHGLVDVIKGTNFLLIIILAALVFINAIKVFSQGRKVGSILSIIGVSSFLFTSLLVDNDYIVYASYVFYLVSIFYVLYNVNNKREFKKRICNYTILKVILILVLSILGNITKESALLLYLIDIMLILELFNAMLPKNYLYVVLEVALVLLLLSNIYVFRNVQMKYGELNLFIKNKLECTRDDFIIPSRFNIDYIVDYLPKDKTEFEEYIRYYDISPYDTPKDINFKFKE